ncbi:hypothetical protein K493DRAFT_348386 [Basidiobolus meristosporus CBS 931.73]|uniref:Uncharacterized protein n=1 Tax=Basidiobolus meristosporus CBS 931.73 TaxID=1314790 RepID=A0A1Y1YNZ9_9FUNG|nr:hypothetical protein K493DRAFT_348386 [Basidiobolus meristosporus CBS 931.73]|eukprot:ORX99739.1 hypothetical protein K493DRAFT_348386 [Basidiobolus meristosporus CBS 931.73]
MFQPKPDTNVAQTGRLPFGPPTVSQDSQIKSHRDILRRHNEEYQLAQGIKVELSQAQAAFPSTFVGRMSKNNNTVIPVLPRLKNPDAPTPT